MTNQKPKTQYYYKLFRVRRNDGRVTTVSVDPILATKACQLMGVKGVGKLVREAAMSYNTEMHKNCSGFVSEQLRKAVAEATAARRASQAVSQLVAA